MEEGRRGKEDRQEGKNGSTIKLHKERVVFS